MTLSLPTTLLLLLAAWCPAPDCWLAADTLTRLLGPWLWCLVFFVFAMLHILIIMYETE